MDKKKVNITVSRSTWQNLFKMKTKPSQTFDEIISKLIEICKEVNK